MPFKITDFIDCRVKKTNGIYLVKKDDAPLLMVLLDLVFLILI